MTTIKLKIDLSKAKGKINKTNIKIGQIAIANQALIDMDPYIPLKNGPLRLSGHVTGNGSQIVYNTPYARAQFTVGHTTSTEVLVLTLTQHLEQVNVGI